MANYYSSYRTNYFRVTDENRWNDLFSKLSGDDLSDFSEVKDGIQVHGFGGYDYVAYDIDGSEDYEGSIDEFLTDLREILPEGEAVIYTETGHEKLRYVSAFSIVATKNSVESINLQDAAIEKAREMLRNDKFTTIMDY